MRRRDLGRWAAWFALGACLAAAALLRGGVDAPQFQYLALVISAAAALSLALPSRRRTHRQSNVDIWLLSLLTGWMLLALVPLPLALVSLVSPERGRLALAAHALTGGDAGAWTPLSVAPPATVERLLFLLPAFAIFVAAREMPRWWTGRKVWIAVAPVIGVALLEAVVGMAQFNAGGDVSAGARPVSGTYVNRNHYAGLLELALPLALTWALALWLNPGKPGHRHRDREQPMGAAIGAGLLLLTAAVILAGVVTSQSRMGFAAALSTVTTVALGWLVVRRQRRRTSSWMWLLPLALPVGIILLVATNTMVLRFVDTPGAGDITADGRVQIWRESWQLFKAYPLTGSGLGTFEHALYPFRVWMPTSAVDFAHNDYLQILTELGVVGFALAIALALHVTIRILAVAFRTDSRQQWLGVGLLAALVAGGLHGLVDFNLYIPANALALAWLAGVAVSPGMEAET